MSDRAVSSNFSKIRGVSEWELLRHYMEPIYPFFNMEGVTEIFIDQFNDIKIERFGEKEKVDASFASQGQLVTFIQQIARLLDQPFNEQHPEMSGELPTGARVNATLHNISADGTSMNIRCFPKDSITPTKLLEFGSLTEEMLDYLRLCVKSYCNIFVAGSTGSGKTTLLNALSRFFNKRDRVVTVEDTAELQVDAFSRVRLVAPHRKRRSDDDQEITMSYLIGVMLRRTPDRPVVGEIRFPDSAYAFMTGLNTGHKGGMATIHANGCQDALERLDGLVAAASGNLPFQFIQDQVRKNIDLVIYAEKTPMFGRRITEISEVIRLDANTSEVRPMFKFNHKRGLHESMVDKTTLVGTFERYGLTLNK